MYGKNSFSSLLENNVKTCLRRPISEGFSRIQASYNFDICEFWTRSNTCKVLQNIDFKTTIQLFIWCRNFVPSFNLNVREMAPNWKLHSEFWFNLKSKYDLLYGNKFMSIVYLHII